MSFYTPICKIVILYESSYIQYLDANNFYGWAMSKKLPVNEFKWLNNNKINEEFIKNYNENDKKRIHS